MSGVGAKSLGHSAFSAAQLLSMQIATFPCAPQYSGECFSVAGEFMADKRKRLKEGRRGREEDEGMGKRGRREMGQRVERREEKKMG